MVTEYAQNMEHWEEWQKEYRFGVILILPPEPLLTQVNALRTQYDPLSQAACDAHISLTVPLAQPLDAAQWRELGEIAATLTAFPIRYGPLKHYLPHPGICLQIEPQYELNHLRLTLEQASVFKGAPERKYPFSAHMTIAEFITEQQTLALMDELKEVVPTGHFPCMYVSYMVPDVNFHFTERGRLPLAPEALLSEG